MQVEVRSWASLVVELNRARVICAAREDLRIDVVGPPCERFARFLGARRLDLRFEAFVTPRLLPGNQRACWRLELRGPGPAGVGERLAGLVYRRGAHVIERGGFHPKSVCLALSAGP